MHKGNHSCGPIRILAFRPICQGLPSAIRRGTCPNTKKAQPKSFVSINTTLSLIGVAFRNEYSAIEKLASAKKIDVSYFSRMPRLNSLVPDIVEAIWAGEDPNGISLRKLYR